MKPGEFVAIVLALLALALVPSACRVLLTGDPRCAVVRCVIDAGGGR